MSESQHIISIKIDAKDAKNNAIEIETLLKKIADSQIAGGKRVVAEADKVAKEQKRIATESSKAWEAYAEGKVTSEKQAIKEIDKAWKEYSSKARPEVSDSWSKAEVARKKADSTEMWKLHDKANKDMIASTKAKVEAEIVAHNKVLDAEIAIAKTKSAIQHQANTKAIVEAKAFADEQNRIALETEKAWEAHSKGKVASEKQVISEINKAWKEYSSKARPEVSDSWSKAEVARKKADSDAMWKIHDKANKDMAASTKASAEAEIAAHNKVLDTKIAAEKLAHKQMGELLMHRYKEQTRIANEQRKLEASLAKEQSSLPTTNRLQDLQARLAGVRAEISATKDLIKANQSNADAVRLLKAELVGLERTERNLLTGNARGRGEFHKLFAGLASATFEFTGAVFGLGIMLKSITWPVAEGIKFLSTLENTKVGMAGILMSMGKIDGASIKLPQALKISSDITKQLIVDSMKYGVNLEALATTTRAIMAPGLAAGMNLKEIQQVATLGTLAVKTIGLDSRQAVQEIRDLVAGGIQAASSTLATSLSIRDSDIKRWREAGTLFDELTTRLKGMGEAGEESTKTLSGSWDILKQKFQLLFVNEEAFSALKGFIADISNSIGKIDEQTGNLVLNPDFVKQAKEYISVITEMAKVLGQVVKLSLDLSKYIDGVVVAMVGMKIVKMLGIDLALVATNMTAVSVASKSLTSSIVAVETSAAASGSAIAGLSRLASGASGGLFGLMLFGLWELADYSGALDKLVQVYKDAKKSMTNELDWYEKGAPSSKPTTGSRFLSKGLGKPLVDNSLMSMASGIVTTDPFIRQAKLNAEAATQALELPSRQVEKLNQDIQKAKENLASQKLSFENIKSRIAKGEVNSSFGTLETETEEHLKAVRNYTDQIAVLQNKRDEIIKRGAKEAKKSQQEIYKAEDEALHSHITTMQSSYSELDATLTTTVQEGSISLIDAFGQRQAALRSIEDESRKYHDADKTDAVIKQNTKLIATAYKSSMSELINIGKEYTQNIAELNAKANIGGGTAALELFRAQSAEKRKLLEMNVRDYEAAAKNIHVALTREQTEIYNTSKADLALIKANEDLVKSNEALGNSITTVEKAQSDLANTTTELEIARLRAGGGYQAELDFEKNLLLAKKATLAITEKHLRVAEDDLALMPNNAIKVAGVDKLRKSYNDQTKDVLALEIAQDKTFGKAANDAFEQYAKTASDTAGKVRDAFTNAFKTLEDVIYNFFKTGKLSFSNFVGSIKDSLMRLASQKIVMSIGGVFMPAVAGAANLVGSVGTAASAAGAGSAFGGLSFSGMKAGWDTFTSGLNGAGMAMDAFVQDAGIWLGNQGFGKLGSLVWENSKLLSQGAAYLGAGISLLQGDIKGAAFQGAGATIGGLMSAWNPAAMAIGSMLGGIVGSFFGGGKELPEIGRSQVAGKYFIDTQKYTSTKQATSDKPLGAEAGLASIGKQFTASLDAILKTFGVQKDITTTAHLQSGGSASRGYFTASFGNATVSAGNVEADASNVKAAFDKLVKVVFGKVLASAIVASDIPKNIGLLFKGMTDQAKIANMLGAVTNLYNAQENLQLKLGISADKAAEAAKATGLADDALVAYIVTITDIANSTRSAGDIILLAKKNLQIALGDLIIPESLSAYDAAIKAVDKSTSAGLETFNKLIGLRPAFIGFTDSLNALKNNVNSAIYDMSSPEVQQQSKLIALTALFAGIGRTVPKSAAELIALGKSIDYTTKEGLDLAAVFPTLVTAFKDTKTAVDSLIQSLDPKRFKTYADYRTTQAYMSYGVQVPSFDVGTNLVTHDTLAKVHKDERIMPAADNRELMARLNSPSEMNATLIAEVKALREELQGLRAETRAVVDNTYTSAKLDKKHDNEGMPPVRTV